MVYCEKCGQKCGLYGASISYIEVEETKECLCWTCYEEYKKEDE